MKRSELKSSFSKGKKPKESDFHGLLDSYIHKTDDAEITIDENTQNVGIGILSPAAKLHVNGGLVIGNVQDPDLENGVQIFQGTLRWTGTKLEIFVGDRWKTVWQDGASSGNIQTVPPPVEFPSGLQVKTTGQLGNLEKSSALLNFPNNAIRISDIQFTLEYTGDYAPSILLGRASTPPTLTIGIRAGSGALIWETPRPIDNFPNAVRRIYQSSKYALNSNIEGIGTYTFYFKITRGTAGSLSVTPKNATITYLVNSGT